MCATVTYMPQLSMCHKQVAHLDFLYNPNSGSATVAQNSAYRKHMFPMCAFVDFGPACIRHASHCGLPLFPWGFQGVFVADFGLV